MKNSLIILGCFAIGVALAAIGIFPENIGLEVVKYSKYVLFLLMFTVGLGMGLDNELTNSLKNLPKRTLLLPLITATGTLLGGATAYIFVKITGSSNEGFTIIDSLAISSGFGYYSLSSIFLMEARGAVIATIALAANIMRELITLLCAPLIRKWFGPLALISSGGATSMDTTLSVIEQYSGKKMVPLSIYHGVVMDFSVPFFLTLFIALY